MQEIVPGLWRWTAPHSAWAPGAEPESTADWDELVGCVLYECETALRRVDVARSAQPSGRGAPDRASRRGRDDVWLPEVRTLVPGDRLGAPGGGWRRCPESWL